MSTASSSAAAQTAGLADVVDTRAVAEAMLRRGLPSLVLVPAQPLDRPAIRVQQDDAAPEAGVA